MDETVDAAALEAEQRRRAEREAAQAGQADEPEEVATHERRSEKARYLQDKLDERRRSER
jgi:hypothetical protein